MFMKSRFLKPSLLRSLSPAVMVACILTSGVAHGENLRYALGFPPNSAAEDAAKVFADSLEELTDGEVTVQHYALSLLNLAEMSDGVRDGIADMGNVLTPYFPRQYPHANMAAEMTMLLALGDRAEGRQGMAYAGAIGEFLMLNCDDCAEDFRKQDQVYFPMGATPEYQLLCTQPVRNLEELEGKRLRVAGAQWSRWASHFGASGVSLSGNEVFEALGQGVVDCTVQSNPELGNFGLKDVVTDITVGIPGGVFSGGSASVNRGVWQNMSPENRKHFLRAASILMADVTWRYQTYGDRDFEEARQSGVAIHEPGKDLVQASRDFVEEDVKRIAANYEKEYGVQNASAKLKTMRAIVEKWVRLVDEAEIASTEDLAALYWEEIFSKLDVNTYGL